MLLERAIKTLDQHGVLAIMLTLIGGHVTTQNRIRIVSWTFKNHSAIGAFDQVLGAWDA
jgi:hypothetical protein